MDVMSTSKTELKSFLGELKRDYPNLKFKRGLQENWSAKTMTVTYNHRQPIDQLKCSLMHEVAHALLEHKNYTSDFELLKMEAEAWELAAKLGTKYGLKIDDQHIQNCLDTYRDWLHKRSLCPTCGIHVIQQSPSIYKCFNCQMLWRVSSGRFVRPYRLTRFSQK